MPLFAPTFSGTRAAGILLHLTSLPGPWGIGDLGPEAENFLAFLAAAGQGCWQILPLGPTRAVHGHSPYMSPSAFAGNPLLISPEKLVADGWLEAGELAEESARSGGFSPYLVRFAEVAECKERLLRRAFVRFRRTGFRREEFAAFRRATPWLADYALFMALGDHFGGRPWYEWPPGIARREPAALARLAARLEEELLFQAFIQFLFAGQWRELRARAAALNIRLIGDVPIYVARDSADVWAQPELFELDPETLAPVFVAGVPPDAFCPEGQAWGNPLYRWRDGDGALAPAVITWWRRRLEWLGKLVDIVRLDHFRGFEACWRIPAGECPAAGAWAPGPGTEFFSSLRAVFSRLPVIAEDLGTLTPAVERLRRECGFAGMKVLQFAFDSDPANPYLPWNFTDPNCVVYSGTHDNQTAVGWYFDPAIPESAKAGLRRAANSDGGAVHRDFIRLAYAAIAGLAVIPLQDVLGYGDDCRMNRPGSEENNWAWRAAPGLLTPELSRYLADMAAFYNRLPA